MFYIWHVDIMKSSCMFSSLSPNIRIKFAYNVW